MLYMANCSAAEAEEIKGNLFKVVTKTGKTGNIVTKKHRIFLNIVTKNIETVLENGLGSAQVVTTKTAVPYCPGGLVGLVFQKVALEDLPLAQGTVPTGVTLLVELPDNFQDMREALQLCQDRPEVRLIGGKLLDIDGVRIGYFDDGVLDGTKLSDKRVFFEGSYDAFETVELSELDDYVVDESKKKVGVRSSATRKRSAEPREPKAPREPKEIKPKAPTRRTIKADAFSELFG